MAAAKRERAVAGRRRRWLAGGVIGVAALACAGWLWGDALRATFVRPPDMRALATTPPDVQTPARTPVATSAAAPARATPDSAVAAAFERDVAPRNTAPLRDFDGAREAVRGIEGVSSAAWLDRHHLFALVDDNAHRDAATAAGICTVIGTFGDTEAITVQLQSMAAGTGAELDVLSHRCGTGVPAGAGPFAAEAPVRPDDDALRALRAQQAAEREAIRARGDRSAEQDAAMKLLESTTPEL